jgi:hypothetical protein
MQIRSQKTCSKLRDWGICIPKGKNNLEDVEVCEGFILEDKLFGKGSIQHQCLEGNNMCHLGVFNHKIALIVYLKYSGIHIYKVIVMKGSHIIEDWGWFVRCLITKESHLLVKNLIRLK